MRTPRKIERFPEGYYALPERQQPIPTWQTIVKWIVEMDRRFRMTQDRIDRMSDRF